jgi:hypothetical protein
MKFLILLSLTLFSTVALASRCFTDDQCAVIDYTGQPSCFLVETGTDASGVKTCRVQCLTEPAGGLCLKKQSHVLGKCVDVRMSAPSSWDPDVGCEKALSPKMWNRIYPQ